MPNWLQEADIRQGFRTGGRLLGAFIVARAEDEFVIYVRTDWVRGRGFKIVRTWRGISGDRSFRNLQSAWLFIRKYNFVGKVVVFASGDPELRHFVGVLPLDFAGYPEMRAANEFHAIQLPQIIGRLDPIAGESESPSD